MPNHTAPDHHRVKTHPDYYVEGSEEALAGAPENYLRVDTNRGPKILAYGRDPNFPGWPDTLQLNYANPELQRARIDELIADNAGTVLAEGDGGGTRSVSWLHLHGRGLLGPRMDVAATRL